MSQKDKSASFRGWCEAAEVKSRKKEKKRKPRPISEHSPGVGDAMISARAVLRARYVFMMRASATRKN
jgi:hypothetical protein